MDNGVQEGIVDNKFVVNYKNPEEIIDLVKDIEYIKSTSTIDDQVIEVFLTLHLRNILIICVKISGTNSENSKQRCAWNCG